MTTLDIIKIKEELLNLIRNSDIIDISDRNVTTTSDSFTATADQTDFTLSNAGVTNIRSLKINDSVKELYTDYDINLFNKTPTESKTITLTSGASSGDVIIINYDYNKEHKLTGEKIFAEYNQKFITLGTIPRLCFELLSVSNNNRSSNDTLQQKNLVFDFYVVSQLADIETLRKQYYDLIFNNRKSLECLNLLRPNGESSAKPIENQRNHLIYNKVFSFTAPAEFER